MRERLKKVLLLVKRSWLKRLIRFGLSFIVFLTGFWLLKIDLGNSWQQYLTSLLQGDHELTAKTIPPLMIGGGLICNAFILLTGSRLFWLMSLFLVFMAGVSVLFTHTHGVESLYYLASLLVILVLTRRFFDKTSLFATSMFAFLSFGMLLIYATFGNFYLADHFSPEIDSIFTAFYFAIVTMSTVGYGDISPQTVQSRLFTISVIVVGLTVFATSLTSVLMPILNKSLKNVFTKKRKPMKRENHYIIIGQSPLAETTCMELNRRGHKVTRLLKKAEGVELEGNLESDINDVVIGNANDLKILEQAGVKKAKAVLMMLDDDSENAFITLAVKELNQEVQTVVTVTDSSNLEKIKLVHPNVILSPQLLGGELAAKFLTGEEITSDFILGKVFKKLG